MLETHRSHDLAPFTIWLVTQGVRTRHRSLHRQEAEAFAGRLAKHQHDETDSVRVVCRLAVLTDEVMISTLGVNS